MYQNIADFDGRKFADLWGGHSCSVTLNKKCHSVVFYRGDKEVLTYSGSSADDILDFVLSEYYENEGSVIEDGFNTYLVGVYDGVEPKTAKEKREERNADLPLEVKYENLVKTCNTQQILIKKQKKEIYTLKRKCDSYLKKADEYYKQIKNNYLDNVIKGLNKALKNQEETIEELQAKLTKQENKF